jgi:hypothetical protein
MLGAITSRLGISAARLGSVAIKTRLSALTKALADLGWAEGRNVRMDLRSYGDDIWWEDEMVARGENKKSHMSLFLSESMK